MADRNATSAPAFELEVFPYLQADIIRDGAIAVLVVLRSALIEETGYLYRPVADYLAAHEQRVISTRDISDSDMFKSAAVQTMCWIGSRAA
ncbi:hypothetical protein AB0H71_29970 [Nocardia sp. NPDC050697]|uniref:hypothetical protein n=1 Tax=Nocardia sp. NPDC050697 TaxID=3155158 RepID=UPI0033C9EA22